MEVYIASMLMNLVDMQRVRDALVSIYLLVPSSFWEVILPVLFERWLNG